MVDKEDYFPDINEIKELKHITDLYSYIVRLHKESGKVIIDRIYFKNYILCSLYAFVWKNDDYKNYEKITEYIKVQNSEVINNCSIRNKLIFRIYMQVIKNKIKML